MSANAIACELQSECDYRSVVECVKCDESLACRSNLLLEDAENTAKDLAILVGQANGMYLSCDGAKIVNVLTRIGDLLTLSQSHVDCLLGLSRKHRSNGCGDENR